MSLSCPNCRESVSFLRTLRTSAWGTFSCRACGSVLRISLGRRLLAGGIWFACLLFAMEVLRLHTYGRLVSYGIMGASLLLAMYLFEKVILLDRRAFTCRDCGYDLHGLPEPRCPECGSAFDPDERERVLARVGSPQPKVGRRWIPAAIVVLLSLAVVASLVLYRRAASAARIRAVPATAPTSLPVTVPSE